MFDSLIGCISIITKMNNTLLLIINDLFSGLPYLGAQEHDVSHHLLSMASWSSLLGVAVVLLLLFVMLMMNRCGRGYKMHVSGKLLTTSFCVVWLAGFVVYDVGMYIGHNQWSLLTNAPMAIVHAFEMFILESDVAAIHAEFHDNWIFMMAFSLVHFLAACITLIFVIKHFGYNIIAGFRMFCEAYLFKGKRDTFIFWGLNDASYLLARSIKDHYGDKDHDYRVIIVRSNRAGEASSVKNGMERLFNFLSLRDNDLERLLELDCLTTGTYTDITRLSVNALEHDGNDVLKRHLSLNQLSRIIRRKTSGHVHMFFISDEDNDNIKAVANMKRDKTINEVAADGKKATLYCKARYNSVHRVIEDEQTSDNIVVKVVDASHISVEQLKLDVNLHPVCYVDVEKDATVSSPFNALVVGFGEVGYDALRFLYEFGAFVKTGSTRDQAERSPFHCDVVDNDIKTRAGLFAVNAPSIAEQFTYDDEPNHGDKPIALHDMDCHSVAFYKHIEKTIDKLNYIVLTLDDDEMSISLAVRLFRLAVRYRKDMNHFRILVRVRQDQDGHLLRIAEHYNRLWAAECNSTPSSRHLHQSVVSTTEKLNEPITLFGSLQSTYTWEYIVSDHLINEAKRFKEKYDQSILNLGGAAPMTPLKWEHEQLDLMQLTDEYKGYSPTFSGIIRLRRVYRQNMENCFHKLTKQMLAKVALGDEKYALLAGHYLTRNENETSYQWQEHEPDKSVTRVLDVIAQTEHLRWVASHEILGYCDDGTEDDKNEARLLHGCLKPWHKLSTRVKSYDYNIVDVSLGIL